MQGRLPAGLTPQLGPDATGVGWVYQYTLTDLSPRSRVLRNALDADGSGEVEEDELPEPEEEFLYTEVQLADLFTVEKSPTSESPEEFRESSLRYIVEAFDRDGDRRISRRELQRAANFRGLDLAQLRTIQDWYLRYDLMSLEGVSEVASVGGFVRQYQVEVDPEKLRAFGVTLSQVQSAIRGANLETSGRLIEMAETEFMVRSEGYIESLDDLETIPVSVDPKRHTPVLLRQVARIQLGPEARRGLVDMNGEGEVVTGIVLLRFGENARNVIERVEERLAELKKSLPEGVEIHVSYDRSQLIERAIATLREKLTQEMLVVAAVCVLFLLHLRSAFVAIFTIPVGVLIAFIGMRWMGINANIMSLGGIAIAIGVMVDASVVMVENLHKHRERDPGQEPARPGGGVRPRGRPGALLLAVDHHRFLPSGVRAGAAGGAALLAPRLHQDLRHGGLRAAGDHGDSGADVLPGQRADPEGIETTRSPASSSRATGPSSVWSSASRGSRWRVRSLWCFSPPGRSAGWGASSCRRSTRAISSTCRPRHRASPSPRPASCSSRPTGSSRSTRRCGTCWERSGGRRRRPIRLPSA